MTDLRLGPQPLRPGPSKKGQMVLISYGFETILPSYTVKQMAQGVGHLNSFSDPGDRNLTAENKKSSNARGGARGRGGGC